jgi:CheY-like chemotaxis protein
MNPHANRRTAAAPQVLLVEDDPGDVLMTRESLADAASRCDLAVVDDGAMALDYLHKRGDFTDAPTPHLVLLDLNLPKVSGHQVLAELKRDPALAPIPVVVISTSAADDDVLATYALHGNAHVAKPVDFEEYQAVIRGIDEFFFGIAEVPSP